MGARVIELLLNNPGQSFFFAFGAGHFVGDHTILEVGPQHCPFSMLACCQVVEKAGFKVAPVRSEDDLDSWPQAGQESKVKQARPRNSGTVIGTMDDLSDDEKTRAFLQLLEYKLRMEKEQVTVS